MSIKRILFLFLFITLFFISSILLLTYLLQREFNLVQVSQDRSYRSYRLANELVASSDQLTRFARTYAVTGDVRFKRYFNMVLDIRNGNVAAPSDYGGVYWDLISEKEGQASHVSMKKPISLEQQMLDAGISSQELLLLTRAQSRSDQLAGIENIAMSLVDRYIADTTGTLKSYRDSAIAMLYGQSYNQAKAMIMDPIGQFLNVLEIRTKTELEAHNELVEKLLLLLTVLCLLLIISFIGFTLLLRNRLLKKGITMLDVLKRIAAGDLSLRLAADSSDEMGELSNSINHVVGQLESSLKEAHNQTDQAIAVAKEEEVQRKHSDKLLNNILPGLIAERLKKGESSIAESFPEVTVLFADIVGFTKLSEELGPRQLVNMLNDVFGRFDELALHFKLEKIKTIGDCYMVVGGVPDRSPTHCQQVAEFAIAARESIKSYSVEWGKELDIRIGIHTGTVVAGVVGKQKYTYDLWGDVVNVASRMESASLPGEIHVTETVHLRLADDFLFESRGNIEVRSKGKLNTYFLKGKRTDS
ncbi:MAG: adenylate/guanylate cyclase domain-containing protein [Arcticibacter sp.]